jgi:hypothetical protein
MAFSAAPTIDRVIPKAKTPTALLARDKSIASKERNCGAELVSSYASEAWVNASDSIIVVMS